MDEEREENEYTRGNWRIDKVEELLVSYFNQYYKESPEKKISGRDVVVVWFCNDLQNWKALAKVRNHIDKYFELSYDGDKNATYFDVYEKRRNIVVGW